ncbi:hypothetical protein SVIOM342S_00369 [Streptomyces violaceorubidus]
MLNLNNAGPVEALDEIAKLPGLTVHHEPVETHRVKFDLGFPSPSPTARPARLAVGAATPSTLRPKSRSVPHCSPCRRSNTYSSC